MMGSVAYPPGLSSPVSVVSILRVKDAHALVELFVKY